MCLSPRFRGKRPPEIKVSPVRFVVRPEINWRRPRRPPANELGSLQLRPGREQLAAPTADAARTPPFMAKVVQAPTHHHYAHWRPAVSVATSRAFHMLSHVEQSQRPACDAKGSLVCIKLHVEERQHTVG